MADEKKQAIDWEPVAWAIVICILAVLFAGEPDLQDAIIHKLAPELTGDER